MGLVLFNIFSNDLVAEIESFLIMSIEDRKLRRALDKITIQKSLDKLECYAVDSAVDFKKEKYKLLYLWKKKINAHTQNDSKHGTQSSRFNMRYSRFGLKFGRKILGVRTTRSWNEQHKEVMGSSSLAFFKMRLVYVPVWDSL